LCNVIIYLLNLFVLHINCISTEFELTKKILINVYPSPKLKDKPILTMIYWDSKNLGFFNNNNLKIIL